MSETESKKFDWIDIGLKAATPLIVGVVIAWFGFFGEEKITDISNRQQSARLITELQVRREQAESDLRKDIFAQALEAFLLKGKTGNVTANDLSLREMSKQLLRLELLALNFGDSLSLSPLFTEMRNDLIRTKPIVKHEGIDFEQHQEELIKRLNSLAKRVASTQLSSLEKHGKSKSIEIPLVGYAELIEQGGSCNVVLLEDEDFAWPDYKILRMMGVLDEMYQPAVDSEELNAARDSQLYGESIADESLIKFQGINRHIEIYVSDVDHCNLSAKVQIFVRRQDSDVIEADPEFRLDYFNFPVVDNTRLSDNHRFAIVAENFKLSGDNPRIVITAVVFKSEYASLRDRPGMEEARKLLESAMRDDQCSEEDCGDLDE